MARNHRKGPALDEAMAALVQRPALTLGEWAVLNHVNRNTAARAVAAGEVEGSYRVGGQVRIASVPWRARLNVLPATSTAA